MVEKMVEKKVGQLVVCKLENEMELM